MNNMDFQAMFLCSIDHILRSAGLPVPESNQNTVCLGSIFCHFLISYRTGFFSVQILVCGKTNADQTVVVGECFSDHIRTLTSSADDLHFPDLLHGKRTKCLGHYLPQQFIIGKRSGTGNDDPSFHISHHLSRNGRILPQWSSTGHYLQHCSHAGG